MKALNLLMILFCFSFQSCSLSQNVNKLEVLDLSLYKNWELQEGSYQEKLIYKLNDKIVRISTYENDIYLDERDYSPFKVVKKYYPDTKVLLYKGEYFGAYSIGTSYSYDKEGNLIEEVNHDAHFSFSVYDLIDKIKKEYGTDLMITEKSRGIKRFYIKELNRSFYIVFLHEISLYYFRRVLLDGNTGEVLYEDCGLEHEFDRHIEDIYLEKLQKENKKE